MDFDGVTTWIFDLDNTLYAPEARLFDQIEQRMIAHVMNALGVDRDQADGLRRDYWRRYGTTLAGMMAEHGTEPQAYLADVHAIDFSVLRPDPELAQAIRALPGTKIVHTNADIRYAAQVLAHRGLDMFDTLYGVEETGFHPKPDARAYDFVWRAQGLDPTRAAMFEDDPRNLEVPHRAGMQTVLVGPGGHLPDGIAGDHGPHVRHQTRDLTAFLRGLLA
ncbi:pyrimidine 5'-nucleotidase [Paracoccus pacificus]|uniref:Pyrimidine 5'-nucleotidase n=1 Tax=Paracoccus pacificus TaxID=1463598 RepID=A0ABW4RBL7_9RHOB